MNSTKKQSLTLFNLFVMFLLFALGGIEYFSAQQYWKTIIFVVIALYLVGKYKLKLDNYYLLTISYLALIFLLQTIAFGGGTPINFGLIFLIVTIPYLGWKIFDYNFADAFLKIILFFSVVSLIFYFFQTISPTFYEFTSTIAPTLGTDPGDIEQNSFIIYTYENAKVLNGMVLRNPGPFWEPSVFANFLIVALFLNTVQKKRFFSPGNVLILLTLITTFSTAAFIALFAFVGFYTYTFVRSLFVKALIFPAFVVLSIFAFNELDFIGDKIKSQYDYQTSVSLNEGTSGRFLGARKSIEAMINNPIYGRGMVTATMADQYSSEAGGYGFLHLGARIAPLGLIFYLFFLYYFMREYCKRNGFNEKFAKWSFLAFLIVLFAQGSYDKPIYLIMVLGGMDYFSKRKQVKKEIAG